MEDEAWVERTLRGDSAAFAHLVEQYKAPVFNLAYRMLGSREDAEDAAQETFLRAYSQLAHYDPGRKFSSWLLSIAAHYCIDQLRRRRFSWVPIDSLPVLDWLFAESDEPERLALAGEEREEIRRLLNRLPAKYRLVLALRYWYDMSYQEIAQATGMTEAAVKTRLHRGREMLAEFLPAGAGEPDAQDGQKAPAEAQPGRTDYARHSFNAALDTAVK